jgi:hypothetical protein
MRVASKHGDERAIEAVAGARRIDIPAWRRCSLRGHLTLTPAAPHFRNDRRASVTPIDDRVVSSCRRAAWLRRGSAETSCIAIVAITIARARASYSFNRKLES